jgi:hypothetical protein
VGLPASVEPKWVEINNSVVEYSSPYCLNYFSLSFEKELRTNWWGYFNRLVLL